MTKCQILAIAAVLAPPLAACGPTRPTAAPPLMASSVVSVDGGPTPLDGLPAISPTSKAVIVPGGPAAGSAGPAGAGTSTGTNGSAAGPQMGNPMGNQSGGN